MQDMSKHIGQIIISILIIVFFTGVAMMSSLWLTSTQRGNRLFSPENLIRVGVFYLIALPIITPIVIGVRKGGNNRRNRDHRKES